MLAFEGSMTTAALLDFAPIISIYNEANKNE
jgi:hypothetical protein